MQHANKEAHDALEKDLPQDWAKLIRKLRWIGLDDEASRLQQAACPPMSEKQYRQDPSALIERVKSA